MFPGRFWVALGSGEASNEHITGDGWPRKEIRTRRLEECVDVIRRLLDGEEVSHDGLVTVDRARLWELPDPRPRLVGPAVSLESAGAGGRLERGLVTVNQPPDAAAARWSTPTASAGGTGPLALQVHLSWAPTEEEAEPIAHDQWRSNVFGAPVAGTSRPRRPSTWCPRTSPWRRSAPSSTSPPTSAWHRDRLAEYAELGFDEIYLHHVGQ